MSTAPDETTEVTTEPSGRRWAIAAVVLLAVVAAVAWGRADSTTAIDEPAAEDAGGGPDETSAAMGDESSPTTGDGATEVPVTPETGPVEEPRSDGGDTGPPGRYGPPDGVPEVVATVDVGEVPEALSGETLLVVDDGPEAFALDLGTGALTSVATVAVRRAGATGTIIGTALVVAPTGGQVRVTDLRTGTLGAVDDQSAGPQHVGADGTIWKIAPPADPGPELTALWRLSPGDPEPVVVRTLPGRAQVVGTDGAAALVHVYPAASTHRITADGSLGPPLDERAAVGGERWVLGASCDDELVCVTELVDLAGDRRVTTTEIDAVAHDVHVSARSPDGRRAVLEAWITDPVAVLVDADALDVRRLGVAPVELGVSAIDPSLRYGVTARDGRVAIVDLQHGTELVVAGPSGTSGVDSLWTEAHSSVVFAPEGWQATPIEGLDRDPTG